jgi:hypothetical protein
MRSAKAFTTFCAAAAFAVAAAIASPAFATDNSQSGIAVSQAELERNGWYCMQSSETRHYYVCTKVFGPTYECHFGICSATAIRRPGSRVSRLPSGTVASMTAAPETSTTEAVAAARTRANR